MSTTRSAAVLSRLGGCALALAACATLLAGCGHDAGTTRRVALSECRLPKYAQPVQCGTLAVPENRAKPDGRRIELFIAVLPANTLSPKPDPLFIIAGGPGQAASTLAPFARVLTEIRRTRDIVLVDQRGTGRSAALGCKAFTPDDRAEFELDATPKARECLAELVARGVDPAQYTTSAWVADLEDVRDAMGYPALNLWGGSYGSRVALEYLRRHPDRVRTLVLDGVAPPQMRITLDIWTSREAALDAVIAACRASPSCSAAFPDPAATLTALEQDLAGGKAVTGNDPRTGAKATITLTFPQVFAALQSLLYSPELATLVPELIDLAHKGDYEPLAAAALALTADPSEQMNAALHYSVTCAEDAPRVDRAAATQALAGTRSRALAASVLAVCDVWPRGSMPADFGNPVVSDVPALLLSGGLDPVTPPAYGAAVAKSLSHSRHVVAAGYGHIVSPHACAPRLVAAFVERAGFDKLPAGCIEHLETSRRPPFFTDRLAARP
jgi:pimeloyl-ACP methyl ester carboxylesterase